MQGQQDFPLTDLGRAQARAARSVVSHWPFGYVWSSDLARAVETARVLAGPLAVVIDPGLRERGAGECEGMTRDEMEARWPGLFDQDWRPESFEPGEHVEARMLRTLAQAAECTGLVLAVTHGASMRIVDRALGGDGGRFPNLGALCLDTDLRVCGRLDLLDPLSAVRLG